MQKPSSRVGIVGIVVVLLGLALWRWSVTKTEAGKPAAVPFASNPQPAQVETPPSPQAPQRVPEEEPAAVREEPAAAAAPVEAPPAPVAVLKSDRPEWRGSELLVRDDRHGDPLTWWDVRVTFVDGTATVERTDAQAVLRWDGEKSVEKVEIDFGRDNEAAWTRCELSQNPDGRLVAEAPCAFVGRILAVAPGFEPERDARIRRLQLRSKEQAGVSFSFVLPRLVPGAEPDERAFAIARGPLQPKDLAGSAALLQVTVGAGGEDAPTWRTNFSLPGFVTSEVLSLEAMPTNTLSVVVLDDLTSTALSGTVVAIATPKSKAQSRVDATGLTDAEGRIEHVALEPGEYHLFVRQLGYKDYREVVTLGREGLELVVRLVPRATLHDYEVHVALPAGTDLSRFRVAVYCKPMFVWLDAAVEPTPDGAGAVARFQRLPAGEYKVTVHEHDGETKVRAEQITLVPGSLRCDFDLR